MKHARVPDDESLRLDRSSPGTVVVSNVYSDSNKGGAAITELTGEFARRLVPGARLVLITVPSGRTGWDPQPLGDPDTIRIPPLINVAGGYRTAMGVLNGCLALLFPRVYERRHNGLAEVAGAQLIVSKGGYLFGHRSGFRSVLGLAVTSFPLLYAWRSGVSTVAYSTSIGPFSGRLHRLVAGVILRRLSAVMVRDSESERQAIKLGVRRSSLILMPDCVFGWLPILDRSEIKQPSSSLLSIVLREAHDIRLFLPTLQNVLVRSERARTFNRFQLVIQADEDRLVTEQFAKSLSHEGLDAQIINTASASPAELVDVYRASAVTISARLHGAIFSLLAGTPAIAIAVDPGKSEGVMAEVGLRDWVLEPDPLASEHLFNRLVEATQDSTVENIRILIKAAVEKLRASESEVRSLLDRANSRRATT